MDKGGIDRRTLLLGGAGAGAALAASAFPRIGSGEAAAAGSDVKSAGIRMLPVVGGKHRVWTKKVGSGPLKLLTLHGGPGLTHEYFECFEDFLPEAGVTFWYYDQLDSHYSDQPGDESLWTVGRYTDEVEEVRKALGLTDFVLYGHSWGGMLAIEYALKHPQHLKAVVISDMTAGIKDYEAYVAELRRRLPPDVIAVLDKYEAKGEYAAPEYEKTMFETVYSRHLCRLDPWPEPFERTLRHFNQKVYNVLQGPNEFVITGRFKNWERWDDLAKIGVPALLLVGRHGTMSVDDIRKMGRLMPKSRVAICENGSHCSMWDDQAAYFRHLVGFLKGLGSGSKPG